MPFVRCAIGALFAVTLPLGAQELGHITFPTSGKPAAQPEFVRGVLLLHSFQYDQAAEAFRRAQSSDPGFAMAYWGEALTYTHQVWNEQDRPAARTALERLAPTRQARLERATTPRERAYLAAVELLYGDGSKAVRDTLYAAAMEQLARDYPSDDEAQILHATALFGLTQGSRDVPTYMRAGAIAQEVFGRNAQHPGAAHMIIHAFDDPVHAPLGLRAAREYSRIAPAAAHAQHMTTHIFLALGMWPEVVAQNRVASGPDSARWRAGHSTHWLLYGYLQQGRFEAARALLASLTAHAGGDARFRGMLANFRARYVLETGRWTSPEAFALDADSGVAGEDGYEYATFASGYAAAERGDRRRAEARLARLARVNGAATASLRPGARGVDVVPVIMELTLRAALVRQDAGVDSALVLLRHAAALEDGMPAEFGPPAVPVPVHESLGSILAAAGRTAEAAAEFARALTLQPGRSAALLGSARTEGGRGRPEDARRAWSRLADNWREADADVPGLADARARADK
ncbi:MAG: tetratricopeptide repeat protein [Gemmatimonadaceae bacterium]|nr:tetratricopeptide repeat protein [Gemmatimonadaceae bacterium]